MGRASNLSVANALLNEAAADLEGGYVLVERTPPKVVIVTTSGLHVGFGLEFTGTRMVTSDAELRTRGEAFWSRATTAPNESADAVRHRQTKALAVRDDRL